MVQNLNNSFGLNFKNEYSIDEKLTHTKVLITNTQCVIHKTRTENFIFSNNSTLLVARCGGYY